MVSALPQRSENTHHVSMIENYPATLDVLGEPMRQVGGASVQRSDNRHLVQLYIIVFCICIFFSLFKPGTLPSVGRGARNQDVL